MKEVKFYNVLFPIWFAMLIAPMLWLIIVPANFIIDSAVVLLTLKILKQENIKKLWLKSIWFVWLFGFVADIIGDAVLFLLSYGVNTDFDLIDDAIRSLSFNPFSNALGLILMLAVVAFSGWLIYVFNMKISFKKLEIEQSVKHKMSLALAIFTAPYAFLIPSQWFW